MNKIANFTDPLLDRQIGEICRAMEQPEGEKFKITKDGGFAIRLTNKTGAASIKGTVINFSSSVDEACIIATQPFSVQGVIYDDGVPDGSPVWCVVKGVAYTLLRDTYGATPNLWVRLSTVVPGRIVCQNMPGYDVGPSSITYTKGSTFSGILSDLLTDNGTNLVMAEVTGVPGIDAKLVMVTDEHLDTINVVGYYSGNHASGILIQCWNFTTAAWETKITLPASGVSDASYSVNGLTIDFYNGTEQWVRVYHPDAGNTLHRVSFDKIVLTSSASNEHFKEIGHTMQTVTGGTNKLVKVNLHIL